VGASKRKRRGEETTATKKCGIIIHPIHLSIDPCVRLSIYLSIDPSRLSRLILSSIRSSLASKQASHSQVNRDQTSRSDKDKQASSIHQQPETTRQEQEQQQLCSNTQPQAQHILHALPAAGRHLAPFPLSNP
jgi:hypothetical protein